VYQFKQYFTWENLLEWSVYILALVHVADEFDLPLVNRYVTHKWNGINGMSHSGNFYAPFTPHRRNFKTEDSPFILPQRDLKTQHSPVLSELCFSCLFLGNGNCKIIVRSSFEKKIVFETFSVHIKNRIDRRNQAPFSNSSDLVKTGP